MVGAASPAAAQLTPVLLRTHTGAIPGEGFGFSLANVGDLTGDGIADYAVGEPNATTPAGPGAGRVTVFDGATGAIVYTIDGTIPQDLAIPQFGGMLGYNLVGVGDWDFDGLGDFAVAEPAGFPFFFAATNPGAVHVISGATGSTILSIPGHLQSDCGTMVGEIFGYSISPVPDLDGDGATDLVVGTPFGGHVCSPPLTHDKGAAYVYSGATGTQLYEKNGFHQCQSVHGPCTWDPAFGTSVLGVDLDASGPGEIVVGAPFQFLVDGDPSSIPGSVDLFDGATGALTARINGTQPITSPGALPGHALTNMGDLDNDGVDDFAVLSSVLFSGTVTTYQGPLPTSLQQTVLPAPVSSSAPNIMSRLDDVDLDGFSDILVGNSGFDGTAGTDSGVVYVVNGGAGGVLYTIEGSAANALFGTSVAGLGDLNGDGRPEFLVGAALFDPFGGTGPGNAYVYTLVPPCVDADGDGWGANGSYDCPNPGVADCDDGDAAVNPGATEIPFNGVDDDCDGSTPGGCIPPTTVPAASTAGAAPAACAFVALGTLALVRGRRRRG